MVKTNAHLYFYIGLFLLFIFLLPYILLAENSYITIHDFLDQNIALFKCLKDNGVLLAFNGEIPNMSGLDRSILPFFNPLNIRMLCFQHLSMYQAVVVITIFCKSCAYCGMYLLLNKYFFSDSHKIYSVCLSLGFAFIPFYIDYVLSASGIPLLLYVFINLYHSNNKWWNYVIIAIYAFNSYLELSGFFVLALIAVCLFIIFIVSKKISKDVIYGMIIMCLIYVISNWGTLYSLFMSQSFISHRTEWTHDSSVLGDFISFVQILMFSQYHAGTVLAAPVLLVFTVMFFRYRKSYPLLDKVAILAGLVISGIFIGMMLRLLPIQIFARIQFDRFYFLYPTIVYLMIATIVSCCFRNGLRWLAIGMTLYGLFAGVIFDSEIRNNIRLLAGKEIKNPTFRQFYDVPLFTEIHKALGSCPNYCTKVVSVGMFPAVAEYNGFYTLDSYRVNYPVEYKHRFRKIIENELNKSESLRNYFDNWGSRCYIFSSELGTNYLFNKKDGKSISELDININELKKMGCQYIISAVNIRTIPDGLTHIGSFTTSESFYKIEVYKID